MLLKVKRGGHRVVEGFVFYLRNSNAHPSDRGRERDGTESPVGSGSADRGVVGVLPVHDIGSGGSKKREPSEKERNSQGSNQPTICSISHKGGEVKT